MNDDKLIEYAIECVEEWETGMSPFFDNWNEWASMYRMIDDKKKDNRPSGVSRNITAETPRATNALASSITRMQTVQDPFFELRSTGADEETLYDMELRYNRMLLDLQFKRGLYRGNKGMCLFGTQVWEEPYVIMPGGVEGTDFVPLSLLQVPFRPCVYDMRNSDFIGHISRMNGNYLRYMAYSGNGFQRTGIWDLAKIEEAIKEKASSDASGYSKSAIEQRRSRAGYSNTEEKNSDNELILWHGRIEDADKDPEILQMWGQYGRTDDPRLSDITVGIVNRRHRVRLHPTPYGTWHHMYKIGHFEEFELEAIGYGVGKYGAGLQKDMNRIMRYANDVAKFSLWNVFLAGRGAGLKTQNMNVFPFSVIQGDDINQIKELRPQVEGIINGLKLNELTRDDFRGVTHATDTLQAQPSGATATEATLTSTEAMRAISMIAEINADSVIRPHLKTMHRNDVDQNPYDARLVRDLDFLCKTTTDKDFRPEHAKKLYDFLMLTTSVRQAMPLDFNPTPILKYFARAVGINPRELKEPRPQIDRMLDIMRRVNADSQTKQAMLGEEASLSQAPPLTTEPMPSSGVPTSPVPVS